ncbi:MAG: hypothetical protein U0793_21135 [Gemmataceae bacterium]
MTRLLPYLLVAAVATPALHAQPKKPVPLSKEGRLLYANDDDWDWASPKNAKELSRLSVYGKMPWSALDWMEEGLDEVRGLLVGVPPLIGNYLTMADLNRIRGAGPKRGYDNVEHKANVLRDLLRDPKPPNLIIMMQDSGPARPPITADDVEAAWQFVERGGRLILLDDWSCYQSLMTPFLDKRRVAPKAAAPALDEKALAAIATKVKLLGSEDFRTRETAFQDLLKMGPPIVPILRKLSAPNLEAERRLKRIEEILDPAPKAIAGGDWMVEVTKTVLAIHRHAEVRTITRDGPMTPGAAILIRMPLPEK